MIGIFMLTLLFTLLPLKLVPADPAKLASSPRTQRVIDFCNCFSGGIFLGTCFVQLVPFVESKFMMAFHAGGFPPDYSATATQVVCMLGFFLVLLMDQVVKLCRDGKSSSRRRGQVESHELSEVRGYIVRVSSDDDNSTGSDDSEFEVIQERKRMLKAKSSETAATSNTSAKNASKSRRDKSAKSGVGAKSKSNTAEVHLALPNGGGEGHLHGSGINSHVGGGHSHLGELAGEEFGLRSIVLLFALSIHSLFEGAAVGLQEAISPLVNLVVGIAVHECLVAFALGVSLARQDVSRGTVVKLGLVFSATIPAGVGIGMAIGAVRSFVGVLVSAVLQGLTAGTFIYVIFVEIIPGEIDHDRDRLLKVLIMFVGFLIIGSLRFVMKESHH